MTRGARVVFVIIAIATGAYYRWAARAANDGFLWNRELEGFYNHLARGFADGHLYLGVDPDPALLALPNPWDPSVPDTMKMLDAVLYRRRYYLYHGAGPAVMLFLPWRILVHHDLPENFALFVFCFGGFLFSAGALVGMLRKAGVEPKAWQWALMLIALGTCTSVPFLLNRVWAYEVAIGSAYFCVAGGLFFYFRSGSARSLAASGLMFGMAIACRPHLGLMGLLAMAAIARKMPRRLAAFAIPFALMGLGVATYNYERFGNPLNFGNPYLLGGANQTEVKLRAANVPPGLFYLIVSPPVFGPVFPFVRLAAPPHSVPRPATYTVENTAGALFLAPFFFVAFFVRRNWMFVAATTGVLLFLLGTGWSTQRYEVDFLPWFVLLSFAAMARARDLWWIPIGAAIFFGMVVNLAIGIAGPYDEVIRHHPARFVKVARWFSPIARYRPVVDPPIDLQFSAPSTPLPPYYRQYLVTAGRYELYLENVSGRRTLISSLDASKVQQPLAENDKPVHYRVIFSPASEEIHVTGDGAALIDHKIGPLVAAPSQIEIH